MTLGKFGPDAKPAASNLAKLLKDKDLGVRKAAQGALQKIAPEQGLKRASQDSLKKNNNLKSISKGGQTD